MTEEWEYEEEDEGVEDEPQATETEFTIERNKPLPRSTGRRYPFDKMRIGDSFEVRIDKGVIEERGLADAVRLQRSALSSSASNFNRRNDDRRMVIRKTGPTTLRCWCVEPE